MTHMRKHHILLSAPPKAKGVTINSDVEQKIIFKAMKKMVDEKLNRVTEESMENFE
ncbi:Protein CBG27655 [Caenorhabditis briggsae]|uniref:Protein CBG27655 n=1 Tax=Caenorhabditis briggsae TaxID=6238 RepID=B6IJA0_CAEBR|nr:Protein CBG27655 [Caenorhabditis briggsae]CAR99934.1 Protein CBG27655 [Caenorhabditis briggsae]